MQNGTVREKLNTAVRKPSAKAAFGRRKAAPLLLALLLTLMLGLSGCASVQAFLDDVQKTDGQETVKVALFQPLSGEQKEAAAPEIRGVELAHKLYPAVLGMPVELVYADNRSSLTHGREAAETLAKKDPAVVLGSYGNTLSLSGLDAFIAEKIPVINLTGTNPLLTAGSIFSFRVSREDTDQGSAAARFLKENLQISNAAVLTATGDDFGMALGRTFSETLEDLVDLDDHEVQTVTYMKGSSDYSLQIAVLKSCKVDAVFLTGTAEDAAAFIKQAKAAGLSWTFIGSDELNTEAFLTAAESAAEGVYAIGSYDPLNPITELGTTFLNAYREEYGADAVPTEAEALGFEAYVLSLKAIEAGGSVEGDSIKAALMLMETFEGVTGNGVMDEEGDLLKTIPIRQVTGGQLITAATVDPY